MAEPADGVREHSRAGAVHHQLSDAAAPKLSGPRVHDFGGGLCGLRHIEADACGRKDFSPIIEQALALGGYEHDHSMSGINGGHMLMTGFAHGAVLAHAEEIISLIKSGKVRHIFLVGGCDGAHPGRNYYTEFVKSHADGYACSDACVRQIPLQ